MKCRNYTIDFIISILLSYAIFFYHSCQLYIIINKLYLMSINGKLDSNDICSVITLIGFIYIYV